MTLRPWLVWGGGMVVATVFISCAGAAWVIEATLRLAVGWFFNLRDVLPRVRVNAAGVAVFVLALPVAAWLAHTTGRWLVGQRWRWKWTLTGLAAVLLMFVAGVAATGVVHQTGWLIRSPVPLLENRSRLRIAPIKCAANLRQIGLALKMYIHEGGAQPKSRGDLARLVRVLDLTPDVFICPATDLDYGPTTNPADWASQLDDDQHFSYVVAQGELRGRTGKQVIMHDIPHNHEDGMNVLYDDGQVEWLDRSTADHWLTHNATTQAASTQPSITR